MSINNNCDKVIAHAKKTGKFQTLYKTVKGGKTQFWNIKVVEDDEGFAKIIIHWGRMGSKKIQEKINTETKIGNLGKSNETSPYERQMTKALKMYADKLETDYSIDKSEDTRERIIPMLAYQFKKYKIYVNYPAAGQAKLDGIRGLAGYDQNNVIHSV